MTIFLIAVLHAAAVFLVALFTGNRVLLVITSIIAGIFAVTVGGDSYSILDLFAVFIGLYLGWPLATSLKGAGILTASIFSIIGALILFNHSIKSSEIPIKTGYSSSVLQTPKVGDSLNVRSNQGLKFKEIKSIRSPDSIKSDCYKLLSDSEILECLNTH